MLNYREFEAGPDPFGRKFHVYFKWIQNAITLRHADTVDVKFVLDDDGGSRTEKTIALMHPDLLTVSREMSRPLDDSWCSRLAALHLIHLISTGEDIEKELVTPSLADVRRHANELRGTEQPVMQGR